MAENMIKFLRGNVASLPQTATAGAVYFTKDEGLYLGLEDGSYHRYGDFITVANVDSLPETGAHQKAMYYCVAENILAKWDGSAWVQINKQKTLAELGGVAKSVYEAKIAALEKADSDNAALIGGVDERLKSAEEKLKSVATTEGLGELTDKVAIAEGDIDKLEAAIGDGGSVTLAIADAKKAGTDAAGAAATAQAAADKAQGDVDALSAKVGSVADGKTVAGLIADTDAKAAQGVSDAATAQAAAEAAQGDVDALEEAFEAYKTSNNTAVGNAQSKADQAYSLAEGRATMEQVNAAIAGAGHAVKNDVDQAIADMDAAYKQADADLKTELQGKIDAKVAQSDYDAKVAELAGADTTLQGNIDAEAEARVAADNAQVARIAALEGQITGLSGAMHFKGVKTEIPEDVTGYVDGDVIIVGDKEYVFNVGAFVELGDVSAEGDRISALEMIINGKEAEGDNAAVPGLVDDVAANSAAISAEKTRAEAKEAELAQADATNLQTAKDYADAAVAALKIEEYAKQTVLDGAVERIGTAEGKIADLEAASTTHATQSDLTNAINAEVERANGAYAGKALETAVSTHVGDTNVHVTTEDKTKWNGAQAAAEATAAAALASARTEITAEIATAKGEAIADADSKIAAAVETVKTDASNKDAVVLAEAQKSVNTAKSELQGNIDAVSGALNTYKTDNDKAVALKANAADVYNKAEVEAMLTWGDF